jgi:hypothetical protein
MTKVVFTGRIGEVDSEDGGQALITQIDPSIGFTVESEGIDVGDEDNGFFVRLQSWSEITKQHRIPEHPFMDAIRGRLVRVTVEIIEESHD